MCRGVQLLRVRSAQTGVTGGTIEVIHGTSVRFPI